MSIDFLTTKHPLLAGLVKPSNLTNPLAGLDSPGTTIIPSDGTTTSGSANASNASKASKASSNSDTGGQGNMYLNPGQFTLAKPLQKTVLLNGIPYTLTDRKEETMEKVSKFYSDFSNLERMLDVVEGRSRISLRLLDWLVTNYAKKYDIIYGIQKGDDLRQFMVYQHYRAQLKAYQKELFDPFCRHERIKFHYGDGKILRTTVGQLNFFRWAIENLVLDYAENHFEEITEDMKLRARSKGRGSAGKQVISSERAEVRLSLQAEGQQTQASEPAQEQVNTIQEPVKAPQPAKRGPIPIKILPKNDAHHKNKKKELSISASKTISTHEVKILVRFD